MTDWTDWLTTEAERQARVLAQIRGQGPSTVATLVALTEASRTQAGAWKASIDAVAAESGKTMASMAAALQSAQSSEINQIAMRTYAALTAPRPRLPDHVLPTA